MDDKPKKVKVSKEKMKEYYEAHKNRHNEPLFCDVCNINYAYYSKSRHMKSDTHLNNVRYNKLKDLLNKTKVMIDRNEFNENMLIDTINNVYVLIK